MGEYNNHPSLFCSVYFSCSLPSRLWSGLGRTCSCLLVDLLVCKYMQIKKVYMMCYSFSVFVSYLDLERERTLDVQVFNICNQSDNRYACLKTRLMYNILSFHLVYVCVIIDIKEEYGVHASSWRLFFAVIKILSSAWCHHSQPLWTDLVSKYYPRVVAELQPLTE